MKRNLDTTSIYVMSGTMQRLAGGAQPPLTTCKVGIGGVGLLRPPAQKHKGGIWMDWGANNMYGGLTWFEFRGQQTVKLILYF